MISAACSKIEKEQTRYRLPDHFPGHHCWDDNDSRYLICEANYCKPDIVTKFVYRFHFSLLCRAELLVVDVCDDGRWPAHAGFTAAPAKRRGFVQLCCAVYLLYSKGYFLR
ncbi:unnamed protein product [Gongylonema pulchrum]|uniref:Uncharacterized protein n=1 Tax=Gongylonema pulchrum TaxID=637853 RepID=A0A3P7M9D7_9BILA|nr:unnamed protein product [Gongylonema pulchrum]